MAHASEPDASGKLHRPGEAYLTLLYSGQLYATLIRAAITNTFDQCRPSISPLHSSPKTYGDPQSVQLHLAVQHVHLETHQPRHRVQGELRCSAPRRRSVQADHMVATGHVRSVGYWQVYAAWQTVQGSSWPIRVLHLAHYPSASTGRREWEGVPFRDKGRVHASSRRGRVS